MTRCVFLASDQHHAASVETLFFDVFGTLVDWRGSIAREAKTLLEPPRPGARWVAFAWHR